ncbi:MAG: hypothetical protein P8K81_00380 [Flavobacteriales bacterium]|nr:hypothetical protein [Flavobacteriales bacterium]
MLLSPSLGSTSLLILGLSLTVLSGCKPEVFVYEDNPVPAYDEISTILVQNYVNRFYIDLIGREPNDEEMERDVAILEEGDLTMDIRLQVLDGLIEGMDSIDQFTYRGMVYQKLYTDLKARFLEGASDGILNARYGLLRGQAINDSLNGNYIGYSINQAAAERMQLVLLSRVDLESGLIDVREVCHRMIWNSVYDMINMNSFNFIQACFDDLYQRFPTSAEFDAAYAIIEFNQPEEVFGMAAQDKPSFLDAMLLNPEWDEGMVRWVYRSFLARDPSDGEVIEGMNAFANGLEVSTIQRLVLQSDEYAGF